MKDQFLQSVKQAVKHWWVSLLIGILAVILGIWSMVVPDVTLVALTYVFVCMFIISGLFEISFSIANRNILHGWGWTLAGGIIDLLFGFILLLLPPAAIAMILIYFVGFWIMFRGVWMIGESFELKRLQVKGWGWFLVLAILTLIFSFVFIVSPLISSVFIVAFVSVAFLFYGVFRIYLGVKLRSIHKMIEED